ncbi:hypothetical protein GCM10022204_26470 [Microlunatus aurantiacus]|uniref:Lsr2 protein n=2 Tax=Microlunatus aurantiacus TaxID=446786 RepID=A0ABP7DLB5_9ACTN
MIAMAVRHAEVSQEIGSPGRYWFDWLMSVAADERRSSERATSYPFRMSHEDKRRLKKRAEEAGMTVQGYLEHVALGYDPAPPRRPGPVPQRRREVQEELDISA